MKTIKKALQMAIKEGLGKGASLETGKLKGLTVPQIYQYLKSIGVSDSGFEPRFLGEGSSRVALLISPNKVLKLPLIGSQEALQMGLAQNLKEAEISKKYPNYTPKIWGADPNGKWILVEPVKEFQSRGEFEEQFGGKASAFFAWIQICIDTMNKYPDMTAADVGVEIAADLKRFDSADSLEKRDLTETLIQKFSESEWVNGLIHMIKNEQMYLPDILSYGSWGKTAAGNVVLFDTGTTDAIYSRFSFESVLQETLEERIKTGFDMNEFKALNTLLSVKSYANEKLAQYELGKDNGSSRAAYLISPKKVLKIAKNMKAGLAQNQAEIEMAKKFPNFVPKLFDYNPHGMWLLTEPVREFNEQEDFKAIKGYSLLDLKQWVAYFEALDTRPDHSESLGNTYAMFRRRGFWIPIEDFENIHEDPWAIEFFDFYMNSDLSSGDFWMVNHWGKSADGRVVLLDSGATNDVISKYYQ